MSSPLQKTPQIAQLKQLAKVHGTPLFGAFELTSKCNLDCKMCYIHTEEAKLHPTADLTKKQIFHIIDDAIEAGMMFCLLTGGECLLRADFKEIYLYLYNKGIYISVNTNAVLLTDECIDFFCRHRPERIQISLYGSNNETYVNVTGKPCFTQVDSVIHKLKEAGLFFEIAVTPSKYLYDDFENIMSYLIANDLNYTVTGTLFAPRDGSSNDDSVLTLEERLHIVEIQRRYEGKKRLERKDTYPEPHGEATECQFGMPCNAGTIRFVINSVGDMVPCMCIPEIKICALDRPFGECWDYIHSTMAKVKQAVECEGCPYRNHCELCPAARYDGLFSGHSNKSICEYAIARYKSGLLPIKNPVTEKV